MLCNYGCGQEAKFKLDSGKLCCCSDFRKCLFIRKKICDTLKKTHKNKKIFNKLPKKNINHILDRI